MSYCSLTLWGPSPPPPPPPPPQLGSPLPINTGSILDDYELCEDTIGYGSYSTCKRCIHRATGLDCAVKVGLWGCNVICHMRYSGTSLIQTHVVLVSVARNLGMCARQLIQGCTQGGHTGITSPPPPPPPELGQTTCTNEYHYKK